MATVTASHFVARSSTAAPDAKLAFAQNGVRSQTMTYSSLRPLNKLDTLRLRTSTKASTRKLGKGLRATSTRSSNVIRCGTGMNLVFIGAEVGPWSKTGGLGDVLGGLPPAMAANGHRVMTVSPRYDQYKDAWDTNVEIEIKVGDKIEKVRFFHCYKRGVDRVFVDHPMFLEKVWGKTASKVYGPRAGKDYKDNELRFSLLCQAALEAPLVLNLNSNKYYSGPYGEEIDFIANDWHTSLLPCYLKSMYKSRGIYKSAKVAFCIHNIAYQGRFAFSDFSLLNLPDEFKSSFDFIDGYDKPVKGRKINWMKGGILESDRVITVSPHYAQELVSGEDKGVELDSYIRMAGITGIVNGMDVQEWNPATDKYLDVKFDETTVMEAKPLLKEALQAEVGLPVDRNIPLIGFIGRLEEQKGLDILAEAIPRFVGEDVQIIVLGTGKKPTPPHAPPYLLHLRSGNVSKMEEQSKPKLEVEHQPPPKDQGPGLDPNPKPDPEEKDQTPNGGGYVMGSETPPVNRLSSGGSKKSVHWSPELVSESQSPGSNPYVARSPATVSSFSMKESVDTVKSVLERWGKRVGEATKKAEDLAGNTWQHLRTSPSFAEAAMARIAQGTKVLAEGGYGKIFQQTFETVPGEELVNSFACYLSTSAGPVVGVLYVSTAKLAFCSDNPLSYKTGTQTDWSYYKVVIPLHQLKSANPSSGRVNPSEKYIQVISVDNHEFWFMGFLHYESAVECIQESMESRNLHTV